LLKDAYCFPVVVAQAPVAIVEMSEAETVFRVALFFVLRAAVATQGVCGIVVVV
jgi:hypothetical protein